MSKLGLGISVVALLGFGWFGYHGYQHYQLQVNNIAQAKQSLKTTQQAYQKEQTKHPTIKNVESNYQKALDTSKRYLAWEQKYHDVYANSTKIKASQIVPVRQQLQSMLVHPSQAYQPLVSIMVKDWHGSVAYGGQTNGGKISMAFKYYQHGKLMMLTSFFYNLDSGKLSGFQSYTTKTGLRDMQLAMTRGQNR